MDAVHKRGVVAHFRRQRPEQMTDALLVLHIDIEIADQDDAAIGADALAPARELATLHVALHNVDAILLIERDARYLIEAHHVVLADESSLPIRHVDEHAGYCGFAARNEMR